MSLKTATILAIVGTSVAIALGVIGLIAHFVTPFAEIVYVGRGVIFAVLHLMVSVTYLLFFITLRGKQK